MAMFAEASLSPAGSSVFTITESGTARLRELLSEPGQAAHLAAGCEPVRAGGSPGDHTRTR